MLLYIFSLFISLDIQYVLHNIFYLFSFCIEKKERQTLLGLTLVKDSGEITALHVRDMRGTCGDQISVLAYLQ